MPARRLPLETEMEQAVREAVEYRGGRCWSIRDSRKFAVQDMPDLIVVLPPVIYLVELKSQRRQITDGQAAVLELLEGCEFVQSGIVRPIPRDAGEISYDDFINLIKGEGRKTA